MNHNNIIHVAMMNQHDNIKLHNKLETKYLKNNINKKLRYSKHQYLKQFDHTKKTLHTRTLRW